MFRNKNKITQLIGGIMRYIILLAMLVSSLAFSQNVNRKELEDGSKLFFYDLSYNSLTLENSSLTEGAVWLSFLSL